MKVLAVLAPESEDSKVKKIWGQIRHWVGLVAGGLIAYGVLKVTQGDFTKALDNIGDIITQIESLIGSIMALVAFVSSWFDKD